MNYSAVANHSVNQTVHVESHAPVCLSMKQKNKNCMSAATPECSAIWGCGETLTTRERRTAPHWPNTAPRHGEVRATGP